MNKKCFYNQRARFLVSIVITVALFFPFVSVSALETTQPVPVAQVLKNARVDTSNEGMDSRVAPGDRLLMAVRLANFGGGKKVDVKITYTVLDGKGLTLYTSAETVAVETTANFIKTIPISKLTPPGIYTAKSFITYQDQVVPATTEFTFTVDHKYFGLFFDDFLKYSSITMVLGVLLGMIGHILVKRYRVARLKPFEYSSLPHNERVFYELLSDTLLDMRKRVGDVALDIATDIDGFKIDKNTGQVLQISKSPSKIIALLVSRYEGLFGKKYSTHHHAK